MTKSVAIIGAGLAGAGVVHALRGYDADIHVFEAGGTSGWGASGNDIGMINPRLTAQPTLESAFYTESFHLVRGTLANIQSKTDIGFDPCGSIHIITDDKKRKKFEGIVKTAGFDKRDLFMANAKDASRLAGIEISHDAMVMPQSGCVSPKRLVTALLAGIPVLYNTPVTGIEKQKDKWVLTSGENILGAFDAVVVAASMGAGDILSGLPLRPVRGQVSYASFPAHHKKPAMNLCYGGYLTATHENGVHALGATFIRGDNDHAYREKDQQRNRDSLAQVFPELVGELTLKGGRAAIRSTTPDRFPICGAMPDKEGLFVSLGHGSHGILSSLLCGQILATQLTKPDAIQDECRASFSQRLAPRRFIK